MLAPATVSSHSGATSLWPREAGELVASAHHFITGSEAEARVITWQIGIQSNPIRVLMELAALRSIGQYSPPRRFCLVAQPALEYLTVPTQVALAIASYS
jgi:hypothetical protein